VPHFLRYFEDFTGFLARRQLSYQGRETEFGACVGKILASVVGEAAGAYYLEMETLDRLTDDLKGWTV
jgi:hypothetical protein